MLVTIDLVSAVIRIYIATPVPIVTNLTWTVGAAVADLAPAVNPWRQEDE